MRRFPLLERLIIALLISEVTYLSPIAGTVSVVMSLAISGF